MNWTFGESKIAQICAKGWSWNVRETTAGRAQCRQCGEFIARGEARLTFLPRAPGDRRDLEGHFHFQPRTEAVDYSLHLPPWHLAAAWRTGAYG